MFERIILGLVASAAAMAQSNGRPSFEVASVKPSQSAAPAQLISNPGTWSCTNCRLFDLFGYAFKVFEYQIAAPDWTKTLRFDVVAKLPPGVKPKPFSTKAEDDEFALMMRGLLEERFEMKAHQESRKMPIYELRIADGGHRMQEVEAPGPPPPPGPPVDKDGFPNIAGGDGMKILGGRGRIQFRAQSMLHVAHFVSTQVDRPVLDATGLKGRYALTLSWYLAEGPTIFTAIQKQLGLKLASTDGAVEMVVIDQILKEPTAN